jgi:cell wall-associated NlpC family hydrolase
LFDQANLQAQNQTGADPYNDSWMSNRLQTLLTTAAGWDADKIHISALPSGWTSKVKGLFESIAPQLGIVMDSMSPGAVIAGASPYTSGVATTSFVLSGAPAGAALPAQWGNAVWYVGSQDIQAKSSMYAQMQWGYQDPSGAPVSSDFNPAQIKAFLAKQKLLVCNPDTNMSVVVDIAGWGPPATANPQGAIGLSKDAFAALGFNIGSDPNACNVQIGWVVDSSVQTGPFNIATANKAGATNTAANTATKVVKNYGDTGQSGTTKVNVPPPSGIPAQYGAPDNGTEGKAAAVAVAFAKAQVGLPYIYGGTGPNGYDCSGLCMAAYQSAGITIPRTSEEQYAALAQLPQNPNTWLPGDLVFYEPASDGPAHVVMYAGNQMIYEARHTGTYIDYASLYDGYIGAGRVTGVGTGGTPSANAATGAGGGGTASGGGAGSGSSNTGLPNGLQVALGSNGQIEVTDSTGQQASASFITNWSWMSQTPDLTSTLLTGYRALMNDVPFLPMVETICNASMRSFCSAPNGDFISWFPDYFNVYKSLGTVSISDIELQDFTVNWSDLSMVTHQFTAGTYTASSMDMQNPQGAVSVINMMMTGGVATIDFPAILQELFHIDPNDPTFSVNGLYQRFGARPNYQSLGTIVGPEAEFWYALYLFQYNWATQFAANVPICFMPELYPGMIMQIPSQSFQAYVQQVIHNFDLGPNGGFTTQVSICAPSEMGSAGLWGFAKAGV